MNQTFHWNSFTEELAKKIPADSYRVYVAPLEFSELNETSLILTSSIDFLIDFTPQLFGKIIKDSLAEMYGLNVDLHIQKANASTEPGHATPMYSIQEMPQKAWGDEEFTFDFTDSMPAEEVESFVASKTVPTESGYSALSVKDLTTNSIRTIAQSLNPRYTFQHYVVGASNQFAYAAAMAVAENPARKYNPLFLYSDAGLGKTHLLHAIGNHVLRINPRAKICYISAEKFVNDLILAIQHKKQAEFRQKYRQGYDVLLMDDIQFLANKPTSQEEFFFTFNSLHSSDKQIVVASDKFPKDIPGLEDRIRSRFEWGLVVEVQIPDIETRIAILKTKAEEMDIFLPSDVAMFLASNVKSNVRELEGSLIRLGAKASLLGVEISIELAKQDLKNIIKLPSETVDYIAILETVANHFSIKISDLKSKDRSKKYAVPRQIAMFLMRKYSDKSLTDIGIILGGRDHSTILHGDKAIKLLLVKDPEIKKHIEVIQNSL